MWELLATSTVNGRLFHLLDNLSILVIQATMERASSDFGRCLKQRPKSEEARSIACLRALKSGEARASVPQWHRRPCFRLSWCQPWSVSRERGGWMLRRPSAIPVITGIICYQTWWSPPILVTDYSCNNRNCVRLSQQNAATPFSQNRPRLTPRVLFPRYNEIFAENCDFFPTRRAAEVVLFGIL